MFLYLPIINQKSIIIMNKFLLLTTLLLISFKLQSQDYFKPIDSIIRLYEGKNIPGFIVRVTKNGKTVY